MPESKKTTTKPKKETETKSALVSEDKKTENKTKTVLKPAKPAPVPTPPPPPAPKISFERWFRGKGFKDHWKFAMQAFVNTSGRRSVEEWDQLFKGY